MEQKCSLSGQSFEVSDAFTAHLDKLSPIINGQKYAIPAPKLCPQERMRRRLSFRNQQTLYRRKCDSSGNPIISIYSPDKDQVVYSPDEWWSDSWDAISFGRDYDFNTPFFAQFKTLMKEVPHIGVLLSKVQNSDFTNQSYEVKDCYLSSALKSCEGVLYSQNANGLTTCCDVSYCFNSELLYECTDTYDSYNCKHAYHCQNCTDNTFVYDCVGCKDCFGCVGLRQQQYAFFNEILSADEYKQRVSQYQLDTFDGLQKGLTDFWNFVQKAEHRTEFQFKCENVIGNNIRNSRNCVECYDSLDLEDCHYSTWIFGCKDAFDCYGMGDSELVYDCMGVEEVQTVAFSFGTSNSQNCYYTDLCFNCSNCFGCVALRNKEYCIFNKEYSQAEYEELVPRIIEHMSSDDSWGEFFPIGVSAFAYNESKAFELYPLAKEHVTKLGGQWKETVGEVPQADKVIDATQLPPSISDIPDDVLQWAISGLESKKPYKITKQELEFYRQMNIAAPRLHYDVRLGKRMQLREKK